MDFITHNGKKDRLLHYTYIRIYTIVHICTVHTLYRYTDIHIWKSLQLLFSCANTYVTSVAEAAPPPAAEEETATEAQWMLLCTFASHELAVCRLKWQMKANSTMENEERERLNSERLHMDMDMAPLFIPFRSTTNPAISRTQ